jgi:LPS sulfotransferase NodH
MNLESQGERAQAAQPAAGLDEQAQSAAATAPGDRKIQKRMVVLATPRTGSSHLVELLDSHPQMACLGEVYNPKGTVLRELGLRSKKFMAESGQSPINFLNRVTAKLEEEANCKPWFGFKMMLHHDPRMIDSILDDPSWYVIVLQRQNLLAQWTSMALAKKTSRWDVPGKGKRGGGKDGDDEDDDEADYGDNEASAEEEDAAPVRRVTFDAWKFEQFCFRMRARYESLYHRLGQRSYFRISSEEIDPTYPKLLEFLGVAPVALAPARPAQEPVSMRDRIENYDEYARYAKRNSIEV